MNDNSLFIHTTTTTSTTSIFITTTSTSTLHHRQMLDVLIGDIKNVLPKPLFIYSMLEAISMDSLQQMNGWSRKTIFSP